jgi:hypothetical protein
MLLHSASTLKLAPSLFELELLHFSLEAQFRLPLFQLQLHVAQTDPAFGILVWFRAGFLRFLAQPCVRNKQSHQQAE